MNKKRYGIFILLSLVSQEHLSAQLSKPLLEQIPARESGVNFINKVEENDSLNVFQYEYLYNGAGIGIADFNNDGLQDIFFSGNQVANRLYLNKGNFHFEDITKQAGVAGNKTWSTGVSIVDINSDGLPDIYVCHSGKFNDSSQLSNELFVNQGLQNGLPQFREMAKQYGLDAPGTQSTQAAFFDYDRDGDLDMFLLNHSNNSYNPFLNTRKQRSTPDFRFGNRLFRNDTKPDGSVFFTDVTLQAGIINNPLNFGLSVTISDIDDDGWPDMYTTSDYTEQDCYYHNNHDGTFTQSLQQSFTHISKYAMGADIADYNNDGLTDVFTLDMLPEDNHRQKLLKGPDEYDEYHLLLDSGYYKQQMRNMLQLNQGRDENGNIRFSEIGQLAGVSNTDWSWSGLFADLDNDGWKDLVITNGYLRDYTDMDFMKYTVAEAQLKEAAKGNTNFKTYDLVKKMPSQKIHNYVFKNNEDLTFTNRSEAWGFTTPTVSNCAVYADLDNDGDLDLVIGNNNSPAMLFKNNADQLQQHHLSIQLKGMPGNTAALGAKVKVYQPGRIQYLENYCVRGYQSSVSGNLHFGLGKETKIDSVIIQWPDAKISKLQDVKPDQMLVLSALNAKDQQAVSNNAVTGLFSTVSGNAGIDFIHHENEFIDFKDETLLPYQLSRMGPALAAADVNADGLADVFIGGAIGQTGRLYIQNADATYRAADDQPWMADAASEDVNAIFFDADRDGDVDLYVVSGGNEYEDGSPEYQDRLYINDGNGHFSKAVAALPAMTSSKQAVAFADIDKDGDPDLFVGGYVVPGSFPFAARSYLLRNDSHDGTIVFTDVTAEWCKDLLKPGMVTAVVWEDINRDGFPDLMLAGDWMPLLLFENNGSGLVNISEKAGLSKTDGMWSAIVADDIDNDGDIDFIAGNCGLNDQFKASADEPMTCYAADFDNNGRIDPVVCYYIQGKSYPMASRDELLDQVVPLRRKFLRYKDYADATIYDIFPKEKVDKALQLHCYQLKTCLLINDGQNRFTLTPLPNAAQFSKVSGITVGDFDRDGKKDVLLAGNFVPYRVQLGACDASLGLFLKGEGSNNFTPLFAWQSGLFAGGDVRRMIITNTPDKRRRIILAKNDDAVQVININKR